MQKQFHTVKTIVAIADGEYLVVKLDNKAALFYVEQTVTAHIGLLYV